MRLCPTSSNTAGASGASAVSTSASAGNGSYVDVDPLARVLGEGAARGDDDRHRVADEPNPVACQRSERGRVQALRSRTSHDADDVVEIGGGEYEVDARHRARRGDVDRVDACVCERTAHERGVAEPGWLEVVDEVPAAAQQARVFDTRDVRADQAGHAPAGSLYTPPPECSR